MRIEHEVLIEAPIATVWALTENIEDWPSLSANFSQIQRLDGGPLRVGSRAQVHQPGMGNRVWTVTALKPPGAPSTGRRAAGAAMATAGEDADSGESAAAGGNSPGTFAWEARLLGVRTVATHLLVPTPDGCRQILTLQLRGPGAGLVGRLIGERMQAALATENAGMKESAERRAAGAA